MYIVAFCVFTEEYLKSSFFVLSSNYEGFGLVLKQSQKTTEKLLANPLSETDGLQPYELSLLAFIVGEQCTDEEVAPIYELKNMMNKAGFNNTAFSIGIRLLKAKGFITTKVDSDFNGNEYTVCSLSNTGVDFVLKNTHLFELQQPSAQKTINTFSSDDLPF